MEEYRKLTTQEKALRINLSKAIYGSYAEIGAGQEVAANFFKVGGASGTIAKTISAYDMKFSDAIYGICDRYVCEDRLMQMLGAAQRHIDQIVALCGVTTPEKGNNRSPKSGELQ